MASSQPQKDEHNTAGSNEASKPGDATTKKSPTTLEEDDEFEDFPVEGTCTPYPHPLSRPTTLRKQRKRRGGGANYCMDSVRNGWLTRKT